MQKTVFAAMALALAVPAHAQLRYELSPFDVFIDGTEYRVVGIEQTSAETKGEGRVIYELEDGRLEFPRGYARMPGDEDLWYSLSRGQQERALNFLASGSTIRSSLQPD